MWKLYSDKFFNLDAIDIFLERQKLPNWLVEIDKLNPILFKGIEFITNPSHKGNSRQDGFTGEFYETRKK